MISLWLSIILGITFVLEVSADAAEPNDLQGRSQTILASDWGATIDGLRCRIAQGHVTNLVCEPDKVFLALSLEITNAGGQERRMLFSCVRNIGSASVAADISVDLVRDGDPAGRLADMVAIDFSVPPFETNAPHKDITLCLKPGERKRMSLELGVSKQAYSGDVEDKPTRVQLYQMVPPRQLFGRDKKAARAYWEGTMETGVITIQIGLGLTNAVPHKR